MNFKEKIWQIYTGDYTQAGNEIGEHQALSGKSKSFFPLVYKINFINHLGWQQKRAYSTMIDSINKSYDNVLLAKTLNKVSNHKLFNKTSIPLQTGATMTQQAKNYDDMLVGLQTAKSNIQLQIANLDEYMRAYENRLTQMLDAGFLQNYVDKIGGEMGLKNLIKALQDILTAIDAEIDSISVKIEEDKLISNETPQP